MIWLTQWLCPLRHCAIGLLWDDATNDHAGVVAAGEALFQKATVIQRHCGICGGGLRPEHGRTRFATIEEGEPVVRLLEKEQIRSRQLLDRLGITVEQFGGDPGEGDGGLWVPRSA